MRCTFATCRGILKQQAAVAIDDAIRGWGASRRCACHRHRPEVSCCLLLEPKGGLQKRVALVATAGELLPAPPHLPLDLTSMRAGGMPNCSARKAATCLCRSPCSTTRGGESCCEQGYKAQAGRGRGSCARNSVPLARASVQMASGQPQLLSGLGGGFAPAHHQASQPPPTPPPHHHHHSPHHPPTPVLTCIMISWSFSSLPGSLDTLHEVWNLRCSTPAISSGDSAKLSTWLTAAGLE